MTTILSAEGLLESPEVFRQADALKPGQHCEIERLGLGEYHAQATAEKTARQESWVKIPCNNVSSIGHRYITGTYKSTNFSDEPDIRGWGCR